MLSILAATVALVPLSHARQERSPAETFRFLDVRSTPIVELYFEVRARAESTEPVPDEDPLAPAIELARALGRDLGFFLNWGFLEGRLLGCEDAADLARAFEQSPERFHVRDRDGSRREIALRERAGELAAALEETWPAWSTTHWPERAKLLDPQVARVAEVFSGEQGRAVWTHLCENLAIAIEPIVIPVYLTTRAPFPGAVTHRAFDGALCFVSLEDVPGSLLHESILHESLHALDLASLGTPTLLERLRERLAAAGIDENDKRFRDAPHTLFFLDAAETVRAVLDPAHQDYGDQRGYYAKVAEIAALEKPLWRRWVDGELAADAFLDAIVEGLTRNGR